jgi:hypothetical protein
MRMAAEGAGIVYIVITFPAEYMFKDRLEGRLSNSVDPVGITLQEMNLRGNDKGMPTGHLAPAGRAVRPEGTSASINPPPSREETRS